MKDNLAEDYDDSCFSENHEKIAKLMIILERLLAMGM